MTCWFSKELGEERGTTNPTWGVVGVRQDFERIFPGGNDKIRTGRQSFNRRSGNPPSTGVQLNADDRDPPWREFAWRVVLSGSRLDRIQFVLKELGWSSRAGSNGKKLARQLNPARGKMWGKPSSVACNQSCKNFIRPLDPGTTMHGRFFPLLPLARFRLWPSAATPSGLCDASL